MNRKVAEIKVDGNGKVWVRWQGKRRFVMVQDDEIATYLIYMLVK